ncbi:transcription antitermination protein N [Erwinia phage vB_EhrS_49]|uniref:Transcription antitermination protein N n=1 Tax=Erwinia phage vB_EhrS_49 TaxID=2283026 RepID=A0A4Y1NR46_9CAUD|nr:transcription antitermination protein N [Erwinia phage vB_EhrS_49]AXH43464.1 transcription antitermination protein N [Erwinia phage vB_EhrS_49]
MTIVMTYLASDNARNRRRAKRAAERNTSVTGCSDRVLRAVTAPGVRSKPEPGAGSICMGDVAIFQAGHRGKPVNPYHIIK